MSRRISEILELIKIVDSKFSDNTTLQKMTSVRIEATKDIAIQNNIAKETARDKYRRQLTPDIIGTEEFDDYLYAWFTERQNDLMEILVKHAVDKTDIEIIEEYFESKRKTEYIEWPEGKELVKYKETFLLRIVRDTKLSQKIKNLYDYKCQVCDLALKLKNSIYAEGAHIRPLAKPHNGPDVVENILCLCPNHHVLFDGGGFGIDNDYTLIGIDGKLNVNINHPIGIQYLKYHRNFHEL